MHHQTQEILSLVYHCQADLKQLDEITQAEQISRATLKDCHEALRDKITLIATILETGSTEILEMVEQKRLHA